MTSTTTLPEQHSPTGLTVFGPLPGSDEAYLVWLGPGAGLKLSFRPFSADGTLISIQHPSANGTYFDRGDARAAARAFVAAGTNDHE